jgi:hypothetical protein
MNRSYADTILPLCKRHDMNRLLVHEYNIIMFVSIFDSGMDNLWYTLLPIILTLDSLNENGRMMWALFTSTL